MSDELIPPASSDKDKKPRCVVTPADAELARDVRQFAQSRKWPVYASPKWNQEAAAILRRRLEKTGLTGADAVRVWRWYKAHYAELHKSLPVIASAKRLDNCWDWVVREMTKRRPAPAVLHPDATKVITKLNTLQWPGGAETQLPAVVSQSLTNLHAWLARLDRPTPDRRVAAYRDRVRAELGSVVDYLTGWFRRAHARVLKWADWSGDLGWFVWTPAHPEFAQTVTQCLRRYTGHDGGWTLLSAFLSDKQK